MRATLPYCIADDKNPEDMEKSASDHSADAVRYVLTAANQGRHNFRGWNEVRTASIDVPKEKKAVVYMNGRAVANARRMRR